MPPNDPRNQHEADSTAGFAVGKRVWLADTWDGAVLARRLGEYGRDMKIASDKPDNYGRLSVALGDGTPYPIRKELLRLTPPPSLSGKTKAKAAAKPPKRKEAIKPEAGEELTVFDMLEGT